MILSDLLNQIKTTSRILVTFLISFFLFLSILILSLLSLLLKISDKTHVLIYISLFIVIISAFGQYFSLKKKEMSINLMASKKIYALKDFQGLEKDKKEYEIIRIMDLGPTKTYDLSDGSSVEENRIKKISDHKVTLYNHCKLTKGEKLKLLYVFKDEICLIEKSNGEKGLVDAHLIELK